MQGTSHLEYADERPIVMYSLHDSDAVLDACVGTEVDGMLLALKLDRQGLLYLCKEQCPPGFTGLAKKLDHF